ncbi:hypothetical protein C8F04DRAFT_1138619 [Mycena alexandri]|uniref:Uncharacterized protein n=1 Tax=Mycena alexandri TaxID=1745969 RepID=A0AAD6S7V4_9AGAR|nr:hypothetical protein C8F04DRAFT_1138619 [Mycena alexandri]
MKDLKDAQDTQALKDTPTDLFSGLPAASNLKSESTRSSINDEKESLVALSSPWMHVPEWLASRLHLNSSESGFNSDSALDQRSSSSIASSTSGLSHTNNDTAAVSISENGSCSTHPHTDESTAATAGHGPRAVPGLPSQPLSATGDPTHPASDSDGDLDRRPTLTSTRAHTGHSSSDFLPLLASRSSSSAAGVEVDLSRGATLDSTRVHTGHSSSDLLQLASRSSSSAAELEVDLSRGATLDSTRLHTGHLSSDFLPSPLSSAAEVDADLSRGATVDSTTVHTGHSSSTISLPSAHPESLAGSQRAYFERNPAASESK